jgi:hypothetical protein
MRAIGRRRRVVMVVAVGLILAIGGLAWAIIQVLAPGVIDVATADVSAVLVDGSGYTNDDGVVDGALEPGDDGRDPVAHGWEPGRDAGFASCALGTTSDSVSVAVASGYSGYHCTWQVDIANRGDTELALQSLLVTDGGGGTSFTNGTELEVGLLSTAGCGLTIPVQVNGGELGTPHVSIGLLDVAPGTSYDVRIEFQLVPTSLFDPALCSEIVPAP